MYVSKINGKKIFEKKNIFFCFSKHFKTITINHICTKIIIIIKTAILWKIVCFFFGLLFRLKLFLFISISFEYIRSESVWNRRDCTVFSFNNAAFSFLFSCSYNCEMETGSKEPQDISIENSNT